MSGQRDFFEALEARTPREKELADEYEALTRMVIQLARLREQHKNGHAVAEPCLPTR